jgi:hypothetical protein
MTFRLNHLIAVLIFLTSCSRTVEIPDNNVGIVYRKDKVLDTVLQAGSHKIGYSDDLTFYHIGEQKMDFKFDVLFQDASSADINFSVSYNIKVNDLAKICKRYEQPAYYNSISIIVEVELKKQIRDLLLTLDQDQFTEKELFNLIENHLKSKKPTVDIIELKSFLPGAIMIKE